MIIRMHSLLVYNLKLLAFFFIMLMSGNYVTVATTTTTKTTTTIQDAKLYDYCCFNNKANVEYSTLSTQPAIGLQVSKRDTHQLLSRIFAIFLREVLHYEQVYLKYDNEAPMRYLNVSHERQKLAATLQHISYQPDQLDLNMIDLEVWMPALGHQLIPTTVQEAGASLNPARFGWFVNKKKGVRHQDMENLSYTIFQDRHTNIYQRFLLPPVIKYNLHLKLETHNFFQSPFCEHIFACVILFAEYKSDTQFLVEQIIETKSYLNVVWLADSFHEKLAYLFNAYNALTFEYFIVAHWQPTDVINVEHNFSSILMPQCEQYESLQHALCKYEQIPLLKYYFKRLENPQNEQLMIALRRFKLNHDNQQQLLRSLAFQRRQLNYSTSAMPKFYDKIACNWLKNNTFIYKNWLTAQTTKQTLYVGGIFRFSDPEALYGARQAMEDINRSSKILKNYNLEVLELDGQGDADIVLKSFIHYYNQVNMLGILGPACSDTLLPLAGLSKHTQLPLLTYGATSGNFSDREAYPYVFRIIGDDRQLNNALIAFFQYFGWERIAMITDMEQVYLEQLELAQYNIELIAYKKLSTQITTIGLQKTLLDLKEKRAKIIFANLNCHNAQLILCEAFKLQMDHANGYVWILPFKIANTWNKTNDCTEGEFSLALQGVYLFRHSADETLNSEGLQSTFKRLVHKYPSDNMGHYLISFAYDAVWTYALAADKLLLEQREVVQNLRDQRVMDRFAELLWKTDFHGISGHVRFHKGGTRITHVTFMQFQYSKTKEIAYYIPEIEGEQPAQFKMLEPLTSQLSDGRYDCDFSALVRLFGLDCEHVQIVVTVLVCLWLIIITFLVSYIFWRRRYSKKLKRSARIMRNFGIDLLPPKIDKNSLDKWEIPRNNLILNRRLGEGAFGTVYGGEARLASEKWSPVAVKSLKSGASFEDRVDFLSEAEAMKRFDHNNIMKLLGVCLQTEPIYTIMEYMLYGDLKTFLLARRHLVNDKLDEDSEISAKRLTMYALDVARGLAYLAAQRFVHRDIACRNCLVNADRTVKIGDFGMARATYENDYYRFNRKSKLPVRWMAPEALNSGVFMPASDVWAYGVVLYEIITFGAYPYEGLNNTQVLDYVKSGKTMKLPAAIKPNLEKLIKACWSQEQKDRPLAEDVVEYLRQNPCLMVPCLSARSVSLEFSETESSELELELELLSKMYINPPNTKTNDYELDTQTHQMTVAAKERIVKLLSEIDMRKYTEMDIPRDYSNSSTICVNTPPTTPDGYSIMSPLLADAKNVCDK